MFPQCYLNYMNACQRAVPIMPGTFPSTFPGSFPEMMPMAVPELSPMPMSMPMQGPIQFPTQPPVLMPTEDLNEFPSMSQGGEDMMDIMMPAGTGQGTMAGAAPSATTMQGPGSMQGMGGAAGTGVLPSQVPLFTSPFEVAPGSPTNLDTEYTQGYLRTQIGKRVRVSFLLGTSTIQDREGILDRVGVSFIILREPETNNLTLCDIYSIKFVYIFQR